MSGGWRFGAGRPRESTETTAYASISVQDVRSRLGSLGGVMDVVLSANDRAESSTLRIQLTRTRCQFGGQRVWFVCPQCEQRVGVIYLSNAPGCRRCLGLRYPSQSENAIQRGWRRQDKVERLLAAGAEKWNCRRPKGMHWVTFERLLRERCLLQKHRDEACAVFLARLELSL